MASQEYTASTPEGATGIQSNSARTPGPRAVKAANDLLDCVARTTEQHLGKSIVSDGSRDYAARCLDMHFPGYDAMLEACKAALAIESQIGRNDIVVGPNPGLIEQLRAALTKAGVTRG